MRFKSWAFGSRGLLQVSCEHPAMEQQKAQQVHFKASLANNYIWTAGETITLIDTWCYARCLLEHYYLQPVQQVCTRGKLSLYCKTQILCEWNRQYVCVCVCPGACLWCEVVCFRTHHFSPAVCFVWSSVSASLTSCSPLCWGSLPRGYFSPILSLRE